MALVKRVYVDGETIITAANLNAIQDEIIAHESNKVPITRTVNGKALSSNITLSASDVGASPTSHASTATTYGKGTSSNYGHVKISDSLTDTTTAATGGVVPSMKAVNDLNGALTSATGAIIYPTGDSTDRKAEIESRLSTYGYCEFANGTFYISEYIDLLSGQTIKGHGRNSIVICQTGGEGCFVIQNNVQNVTIKDLQLKGVNASRPSSSSGQYGVWLGNGDYASVTIENVYFNGLGRGISTATGYSSGNITNLSVTDCAFKFCGQGIQFNIKGEYWNISNCTFTQCYYGAGLTGGNNKFSCCVFSSNYIAFVLYDSTSTPTNDGHGSATGCSFNHNDTAMTISNIDYGFIFTGCNILYGDITITNSKGIMFTSCLMLGDNGNSGHTNITVSNCTGAITIDQCDFLYVPIITATSSPYFKKSNCKTINGAEVATALSSIGLSKTYTTNSYVSETSFGRLQFFQIDMIFLAVINLYVDADPGSSFREIGRISLPRNLADAVSFVVPSQENKGNILMSISAAGVISIYSANNNSGTPSGFYRGSALQSFTNL